MPRKLRIAYFAHTLAFGLEQWQRSFSTRADEGAKAGRS